jgi:hypothetical protein
MKGKFASTRRKLAVLTLSAIAALATAGSTFAAGQGPGHGSGHSFGRGPGHGVGHGSGRGFGPAPGFRSGPTWHGTPGHFHPRNWNVWRGGHWAHGRYNGTFGWWWVAGGLWYLYPSPIYPYPSEWDSPAVTYVDPGYIDPGYTMPPSSGQYWSYCAASNAYYPYVTTCAGGWQQVPTTPDRAR